jgi:hypothetical protein
MLMGYATTHREQDQSNSSNRPDTTGRARSAAGTPRTLGYFHRKWTNSRPKFFESFSTR